MKFIVSLGAGGIEICARDYCLNEFYFAHCLTAFCLQMVRMESDFQICETASDITCSISKYWKQVNGISNEGAFQGAEARSSCRKLWTQQETKETIMDRPLGKDRASDGPIGTSPRSTLFCPTLVYP